MCLDTAVESRQEPVSLDPNGEVRCGSKVVLAAAAVASAAAFAPLPTASAYSDLAIYEHTGYASPCLLAASHSQRPQPIICPLQRTASKCLRVRAEALLGR